MIPYNFNYRIADINMNKGRNKKGEEYDRKLGAKNGMAELVNIVAGLQKDVKRINSCLTLAGATAYATKKGPNWQAHEADITGPHGKPDGFKEVFVTDANGNIKVINGYTLAKSTYPERKAYWTVQPTEQRINPETNAPYADRDGNPIEFRMPFSKFRKQLYEISPNVNENGAPYYAKDFDDEQFANIRHAIKPKDAFKAVIFDPVYDANREQIKDAEVEKIEGVTGVFYNSGQYQVVLGKNVKNVYDEMEFAAENFMDIISNLKDAEQLEEMGIF